MPLVQPYLEWEIKFNEKYLKGSLQPFVMYAPFWDICIRNKVKVTVNQLRKLTGNGPHPDDRGNLFVFEEAPELPTDKDIPKAIAVVFAQRKIQELGDKSLVEGRESGGMSLEEIKKAYPELFELAEK